MMLSLRQIRLLLVCTLATLVVPAGARAASFDPLGFRLQTPLLFVHEREGAATITIERSDTSSEAQIRYITIGLTAVAHVDYQPVKSMIDFAPGQASATFNVPIVDHGVPSLPKTIQVALFGPSPIGLATPTVAVLTILNDDPVNVIRNPLNPLGTASATATGNALTGAQFFVDYKWGYAARLARDWKQAYPANSQLLDVIAHQPGTHRFGSWDGAYPGQKVSEFLARASVEEPGTVPMIATYRVVDGHCGQWSDPPSDQATYHNWIASFARGIAAYKAVLYLEMDSLITAGCLSRHGQGVRMHELRDAIDVLTANCPRLVIYLDAGAADSASARSVARLLRRSGVAKIQGFFLNSTHFDWTSREIRYGEAISRMTGGKHFVVNTGENGRGPLRPADIVHQGNEVLCNPPGRGLGPKPTTNTGYPNVDAFAWTSNPGESGGPCVPGAPSTGVYWPAYAEMLVRNADYSVR
jgi:endoglucanase